jgi:hypothetical protein
MFLNYTLPYSGKNLYHLVVIGEVGAGTIEFLVKTEFGNVCLKPSNVPAREYPYNDTVVAYTSNSTDLEMATPNYTTDGWENLLLWKWRLWATKLVGQLFLDKLLALLSAIRLKLLMF